MTSSSTSDASTDPLLARFKQLEETVERLHRENRALKAKMQSYNTLCTFYHEARQQLGSMKEQLSAKDKALEGLSRAGQEQPPPLGAPAQSLVEGLLEQLNTAKERLKESERTAAQQLDALGKEVLDLHQQLDEKDRYLQQVTAWPLNEKEQEILRLQQALAAKEKVQATSEVLCRSLTDETQQLQRKLAATAKMCQQLVTRLEEKQRGVSTPADEHARIEQSNKPQFSESEAADLQAKICKLQEENRTLKQKVIYVEDLNAKWQKYDASREIYVKGLQLQLKGLKSQADPTKGASPLPSHAERMQKEIMRLNRLLEEKMQEHLEMNRDVEEAIKARIEISERIQILEQQLLVYKDDFTSERADRERAQNKIQELQEEIIRLKHHRSRSQDSRERAGNFRVQFGNNNRMNIERDNEVTRHGTGQNPLGSRSPGATSQHGVVASVRRSPLAERRCQGELQCPHCLRYFGDEYSEDFLKHIADCCL